VVDLVILRCLLELDFLQVARVGLLLLAVRPEGEVLLLVVPLEGEAPLRLLLLLLRLLHLVRLLLALLLAVLVALVVLVVLVVVGVVVPLALLCAEEEGSS
jgi:hypothetical protein